MKNADKQREVSEELQASENRDKVIYGPTCKPKIINSQSYDNNESFKLAIISQIISDLRRWLHEDMTEQEIIHYYIYNSHPCRNRLFAIDENFEKLHFTIQEENPDLAKTLKDDYENLLSRVSATDKKFLEMASSNFYDENKINPSDVKYFATLLGNRLLQLQEMLNEQELPTHYKTCIEIGGIIRKRSDVIARTLKAHHYPVIKKARRNYCDPAHAAVIWPQYKKHLNKKANLL